MLNSVGERTPPCGIYVVWMCDFYMLCRQGWLKPFATVLFSVCSARAPIYRAMKAFCIHTRTHSKPADLWCRDGLKEAHFWIRLLSIHMWNNILYGIML